MSEGKKRVLTADQRKRKAETAKMRRAAFSPEQKEAERIRSRESKRKSPKTLTPEQRLRKKKKEAERYKNKMASLTKEQLDAKREKDRIAKSKSRKPRVLNQEQRKLAANKRRKTYADKRATITTEELAIINAKRRDKLSKESEKQRQVRLEKSRNSNNEAARRYRARQSEADKEEKKRKDRLAKAKSLRTRSPEQIVARRYYDTKYKLNRIKNDRNFALAHKTRALIKNAFKRAAEGKYRKPTKTEEILGCSMPQFIKHIESRLLSGMTLENHGKWHLDHIIPLACATNEEELLSLNHWSNFQPLWSEDNLKKGSKL